MNAAERLRLMNQARVNHELDPWRGFSPLDAPPWPEAPTEEVIPRRRSLEHDGQLHDRVDDLVGPVLLRA